MKSYEKIIKATVVLAILLATVSARSQSAGLLPAQVPKYALSLVASGSDDIKKSSIFGIEGEWSFKRFDSSAFVLSGLVHRQNWGKFNESRWGLGLGYNYYFRAGDWSPFIGLKRTAYFGLGQTQEALDCLRCSNVNEKYSGGETFLLVGGHNGKWKFQVDARLSNEQSKFSLSSFDPWGVGASGSKTYSGIPDPRVTLHLGLIW